MYEVCMSADERIEPTFDNNAHGEYGQHLTRQVPVADTLNTLAFDENKGSDTIGLLIKSGMVMLMATLLYAGYMLFKPSTPPQTISKLEQQESKEIKSVNKIRKIDLTQTASIKKSTAKPNDALIVKPISDPVSKASDNNQTVFYEVKPGDTLSAIGKAHQTTARKIMKLNQITDARTIKPGLRLVVAR